MVYPVAQVDTLSVMVRYHQRERKYRNIMLVEFFEQQINMEPVRIMLRKGIMTGRTTNVVYIQKIVKGAKVLRADRNNISSVDSSVLGYSALLEKKSREMLADIRDMNMQVSDFEKLLEILK